MSPLIHPYNDASSRVGGLFILSMHYWDGGWAFQTVNFVLSLQTILWHFTITFCFVRNDIVLFFCSLGKLSWCTPVYNILPLYIVEEVMLTSFFLSVTLRSSSLNLYNFISLSSLTAVFHEFIRPIAETQYDNYRIKSK